jgi:iron-sulfur cluster repair protein YtfE (RIC family)
LSDAYTAPLTDTSDMIQFHRVFREALGSAAPLVGSVAAGDRDRAELVASYYANVLALLHGHHAGEDVLVWPRLVERAPEDAQTVMRIADQHVGVLAELETAEERLVAWRADPQIESGAILAASLATLGAELSLHLDDEERVILPIAARHMSPAEWGELPSHGMANFRGDKAWLVMGLVREQMRPEQIVEMEAHMPPPVLEFWNSLGRPQYEAFVAELRS